MAKGSRHKEQGTRIQAPGARLQVFVIPEGSSRIVQHNMASSDAPMREDSSGMTSGPAPNVYYP